MKIEKKIFDLGTYLCKICKKMQYDNCFIYKEKLEPENFKAI